MRLKIHSYDDLIVTVYGKEVPRWVSTPGPFSLGDNCVTVWVRIVFKKRRPQGKLTPMSAAQIRAALKRLPGSVVRKYRVMAMTHKLQSSTNSAYTYSVFRGR